MKKCAILFLALFIVVIAYINKDNNISKVIGTSQNKTTTIYIDPGHGGFDGGASKNGICEKDIVLLISLKLENFFKKTGYNVKLTRITDVALASTKREDIHKRVKMINSVKPDIYISIHANSYPSNIVKGAQTFYKDTLNNKLLAEQIQEMLCVIQPNNTRRAKILHDKYLLENVKYNGCLVEVGFISNQEEAKLLNTDEYQSKIAYAIYIGILKYQEMVT